MMVLMMSNIIVGVGVAITTTPIIIEMERRVDALYSYPNPYVINKVIRDIQFLPLRNDPYNIFLSVVL